MDYGRHQQKFGAPSITIRRGALGAALLDAFLSADITLRLGEELTGLTETAAGVTLTCGGLNQSFDAVIACDGLRSTVRRLAFPDLPGPRYSGLIGTGGVVDVPDVPATNGIMNMTFGKRAFFGYLKAEGEPVLWFNTYPAPEGASAIPDPHAYARFIQSLHTEDPLDNSKILAAVSSVDRNYLVYDMGTLDRWSSPHILLMGDAAHAVAPHSGQGASMAIEDALVLAACLSDTDHSKTAFQRFETLRRPRVEEVIRIGRMAGSQKHAQSWLALRIRDLILPLVMPMGIKAQESLMHFRADLTPLTQPTI